MKVRQGIVVAALGIALMGCGVQPTGVIGAGEPASGLTRGMRLYFASDSGLRGVPLLDREVEDLNAVAREQHVRRVAPGQAEAGRPLAVECAVLGPAPEPGVQGGPGAVPIGHVPPGTRVRNFHTIPFSIMRSRPDAVGPSRIAVSAD